VRPKRTKTASVKAMRIIGYFLYQVVHIEFSRQSTRTRVTSAYWKKPLIDGRRKERCLSTSPLRTGSRPSVWGRESTGNDRTTFETLSGVVGIRSSSSSSSSSPPIVSSSWTARGPRAGGGQMTVDRRESRFGCPRRYTRFHFVTGLRQSSTASVAWCSGGLRWDLKWDVTQWWTAVNHK